ncbi:excinuclease ABC subunit UvrB [Candidatus Marinamargulisbacteria bacterium]|nr:excinuclease ABC subunit UvrB [Candidatus Marinamargulisbacteria bacterium]
MPSAFQLVSDYRPAGDQPDAIDRLTAGLNAGKDNQVLLGVTGSGKTFTIANVIANVNRPALVLAHNKTLAAQLCSEFRSFFPNNVVDYFISYYDYYQPEAYIAARDIYIEKEAQINEEIERLRHHATRSLFLRKDVIIVASVSCIYGLGSPKAYYDAVVSVRLNHEYDRSAFLTTLHELHYERNDIQLSPGAYRVRGEVIELFPSWDEATIRFEFFGDTLEGISRCHSVSGEVVNNLSEVSIFPATHYVVEDDLSPAIGRIKTELAARIKELNQQGLELEAKRLEKRTRYDIAMMRELGYCKGIENYSRVIENRAPGSPPDVLLDFFPDDFITIVDESHVTMPQIRGMYRGDRSRKESLVSHGFRLPSAFDNRPLTFEEFESRKKQTIYVSATPGPYELDQCVWPESITEPSVSVAWQSQDVVEQVIRPTGLVDPVITIRPIQGQVSDLIEETRQRVAVDERVLVTTLTKKSSEELTDYLVNAGFRVRYLHSDIDALERIDILHDLRVGIFDVLVGVNLLREGLDLPEVSLVAILDADKEGFLRNERSLIQTMGRAARNQNGTVILYADKLTKSIQGAQRETQRRRDKQLAYNKTHGIVPKTVTRKVRDIREADREAVQAAVQAVAKPDAEMPLPDLIQELTQKMEAAAAELNFEVAAVLRDQIEKLTQES